MLRQRDRDWVKERKRRWQKRLLELVPYVQSLIDRVRARGDREVKAIMKEIDGVDIEDLRCRTQAPEIGDTAFKEAVSVAMRNIEEFSRSAMDEGFMIDNAGKMMGQRVVPVERVGIYVPGGRASYPSTLLMAAIPARVAGVKKIAVVTPPLADGNISPYILYVAKILGITEIYRIGGVPAIAALAYGTESIKSVDVIAGPGNIYVTLAKKLVSGDVGVDMIAGPSEVVVIADRHADPDLVALDMLAQAEHDPQASSILISDSKEVVLGVSTSIEKFLSRHDHSGIARNSIIDEGGAILVEDMIEAVDVANEIAPEHLELMVESPVALLGRVRNAGAVFLGSTAPEAMGDYVAGPDHILPTMGSARFSSGVSVHTFLKRINYLYYSDVAILKEGKHAVKFAEIEGLYFHALSVRERLKR